MEILIEDHPLPPDIAEPPKVELPDGSEKFATSTYPPASTPPPQK